MLHNGDTEMSDDKRKGILIIIVNALSITAKIFGFLKKTLSRIQQQHHQQRQQRQQQQQQQYNMYYSLCITEDYLKKSDANLEIPFQLR